jgi:hypothetical protein
LGRGQEDQDRGPEIIAYIDSIKANVIMKSEGWPSDSVVTGDGRIVDLAKVTKKDSHDELTNLMIGDEPANPRTALDSDRPEEQAGGIP